MKIAIVYTSMSGNTKELAEQIYRIFLTKSADVSIYRSEEFQGQLSQFNAVVIGTYTWGNGEIPNEMRGLYHDFETTDGGDLTTAVFGTGDRFYPNYCGAVDFFRDMLYTRTNLAATLKVELMLQTQDVERCHRFVDLVLNRARFYQSNYTVPLKN